MNIVNVDKTLINDASEFASNVFIDYYNDLLDNKQSQYMANKFLSKQAITNLIDNGAIFKLVIDNNKIIGISEYLIKDNRVFLSKLYVLKQMRNKGVGKLMLNDCIEYTKKHSLNKIFLTVNKYNYPSIEIYKHLGFIIIDSVITDIGNNYVMDDYIMELNISK